MRKRGEKEVRAVRKEETGEERKREGVKRGERERVGWWLEREREMYVRWRKWERGMRKEEKGERKARERGWDGGERERGGETERGRQKWGERGQRKGREKKEKRERKRWLREVVSSKEKTWTILLISQAYNLWYAKIFLKMFKNIEDSLK